uniref:Uncharacterized protein n=1 Tax=Helianthus annuus TaxID=4232 RepID=A0A251SFA4_HELAN
MLWPELHLETVNNHGMFGLRQEDVDEVHLQWSTTIVAPLQSTNIISDFSIQTLLTQV